MFITINKKKKKTTSHWPVSNAMTLISSQYFCGWRITHTFMYTLITHLMFIPPPWNFMTLSSTDHRTSSRKNNVFLLISKSVYKQQICTIPGRTSWGEYTHISKGEPYVPCVVGVSTPIPSKVKPYVQYIVDVGSPIASKGETLRAVHRGCGVTHTFKRGNPTCSTSWM